MGQQRGCNAMMTGTGERGSGGDACAHARGSCSPAARGSGCPPPRRRCHRHPTPSATVAVAGKAVVVCGPAAWPATHTPWRSWVHTGRRGEQNGSVCVSDGDGGVDALGLILLGHCLSSLHLLKNHRKKDYVNMQDILRNNAIYISYHSTYFLFLKKTDLKRIYFIVLDILRNNAIYISYQSTYFLFLKKTDLKKTYFTVLDILRNNAIYISYHSTNFLFLKNTDLKKNMFGV